MEGSKLKKVGCGIGVLAVLCCGGGGGGLFVGLEALLKSSDPYQEAQVVIAEHEGLAEALGRPVESAWLVSGSVHTSGSKGEADLNWSVSGPKDEAIVYCKATRMAGSWHFERLLARVEGSGETIDLLLVEDDEGELSAAGWTLVGEGQTALEEGRYDEAWFTFDRALAVDEGNVEGWAGRAEAARRLGRFDEAISDLTYALTIKLGDPELNSALARIHTEREDWHPAVEAWTEVLHVDPDHAEAWYQRALCYEALGEDRQALAGARAACDLEYEAGCKMSRRLQ